MARTPAKAKTAKAASKDEAQSTQQQTAVLVLGMHRSGTSALTRVLNLLGLDLGRDLMQAAANNNETGFWEHQGLVDIPEKLMESLGLNGATRARCPKDGFNPRRRPRPSKPSSSSR